jgi:signal transduction histidine kinase
MTTSTDAAPRGNFYTDAWRALPRDVGYLALTGVLLVSAYPLLAAVFWIGVSSIAAIIGIVILVGALYAARFLGEFELARLRWAGFRGIRAVRWPVGTGSNGFWRAFSSLGNPHYWLYTLHGMVLFPFVGIVSLTISFAWIMTGISSALSPIIQPLLPDGVALGINWIWVFSGSNLPETLVHTIGVVVGLALIASFPLVTRVFTMLHFQIARLSLSGFRSEELQGRVGALDAARGAAISAEGHSLRRLERDIHDGPQQRLVRLQMDLAAAERQLDNEPEKARVLIAEAMQQSKEALEELRALSRGFAPPILLDRGLVAALESAAVRSTVATRVVTELPVDTELPQEIERNAYFFGSEALANAAKHSGASDVEVRVALRRIADVDETWLDIVVTDNGAGGAVAIEGHGLDGLEQRLRGFGGVLEILSPPGGPTIVSAHFPVTLVVSASA